MSWNPDDLAFALGDDDGHAALAVRNAAERARHAVAHLAAELRGPALAAALADEVGEPTCHRWGRIGAAALERIIDPAPEPGAIVAAAREVSPAALQGHLL